MINFSEKDIAKAEEQYPGFRETLMSCDAVITPPCPDCGSEDTAVTGCGVVGRSIYLAAGTTKYKLICNKSLGDFFCNPCNKPF